MKATLEFSLPDDAQEHWLAVEGGRFFSLLRQLDEHLRGRLKYAELTPEARHELEEARALLREEGLDLD